MKHAAQLLMALLFSARPSSAWGQFGKSEGLQSPLVEAAASHYSRLSRQEVCKWITPPTVPQTQMCGTNRLQALTSVYLVPEVKLVKAKVGQVSTLRLYNCGECDLEGGCENAASIFAGLFSEGAIVAANVSSAPGSTHGGYVVTFVAPQAGTYRLEIRLLWYEGPLSEAAKPLIGFDAAASRDERGTGGPRWWSPVPTGPDDGKWNPRRLASWPDPPEHTDPMHAPDRGAAATDP